MNLLFLSLSDINGFKGDAKVVRQRLAMAQHLGHKVSLLNLEPSLVRISTVSKTYNHNSQLSPVEHITLKYPLALVVPIALFYLPFHLFQRSPLQTLMASILALILRPYLSTLVYQYDQLHIFHIRLSPILALLKNKPHVRYELIDSYSLHYRRHLSYRPNTFLFPFISYEYHAISKLESCLVRSGTDSSSHTSFVSRVDATYVLSNLTSSSISVVPLYVEPHPYRTPNYAYCTPLSICFFGNLNYQPNIDAIDIIFETVQLNNLTSQLPIKVYIGGHAAPKWLIRKAQCLGISVTSPVDDMFHFVTSKQLCIFPFATGSGLQSKLIDAISWSVPVIVSAECAQSLQETIAIESDLPLLYANSPPDILEHISSIYYGHVDILGLTSEAHNLVTGHLSRASVIQEYAESLELLQRHL